MDLLSYLNVLADANTKYLNDQVFTHGLHNSPQIGETCTLHILYGTHIVSSVNPNFTEWICTTCPL